MDIFKNYTIISLGYNCSIKIYIKSINDQETHLFDWIGSPMWGINKLINDNFDLFNIDDYGLIEIFITDAPDKYIFSNKKYYFKFIHDLPTGMTLDKTILHANKNGELIKINYYQQFKSKYERRIERLNTLLNSTNSIVFLRLEEVLINKKIHDEYINYYSKPEIEHVKEFINIIKDKYPNLKFKLIFISTSNKTEILDNLLILHNIDEDVKLIIDKNLNLINEFLN